jgi:hypothetical protein
MTSIPFYYEVRFNLIAYDKENNFNIQSHVTTFKNENPIVARAEAFEAFDEFSSFTAETNRLKKDQRGNLYLQTTSVAIEKIGELRIEANKILDSRDTESDSKEEALEKFIEARRLATSKLKETNKFKEEISVVLVIDEGVMSSNSNLPSFEGIGDEFVNNSLVIHKISTEDIFEQAIIDNLRYELCLYNYFDFATGNLKQTVYHYGYTYESADIPSEENVVREVLETPYVFRSQKSTTSKKIVEEKLDEDEKVESSFSYEEIIKNGESDSVEFKPTLLYNFKTSKPGISVKYIIAKTINSFLNSKGGLLFIGVQDDGKIQGLDYDYSLFSEGKEKDELYLQLDSLISTFLSNSLKPYINGEVISIEEKEILVITVYPARRPVFLKNNRDKRVQKEFFIRSHASSRILKDIEDIIDYIFNKGWS